MSSPRAIAQKSTSELETLIPPEIRDDEFYKLIERLARTERLAHVLEIGSSAGGGSTSAFVEGLRANPYGPKLYCMEISKLRFEALTATYRADAFVHCFNVSSVPPDEFPSEADVARFYRSVKTTLNRYPEERVLSWLHQDLDYIRSSGVPQNGIELIKTEAGIDRFDMVLIDGSEFSGSAELNHVHGARIILLDDTNAYKCHEARARLLADPAYEVIADNQRLRNGFTAFRLRDAGKKSLADPLPVHFFTIVLNGEPFIRYHLDVLKALPFRWHWHIVEGVASLVRDTAWSVANGGRIDASLHERGRSNDGTSVYLDQIAREMPDHITLYRKPLDSFWNGKSEMVSAPLRDIKEPCLLWQIDSDELWHARQIETVRDAFLAEPERTAAYFWCDFFVGPEALISTRYNYAQNPEQEWLRVWRFQPGDFWKAHEPPTLVRPRALGLLQPDLGRIRPFRHEETERMGAVFQHAAYVVEKQVRFKEIYYGYRDAVQNWQRLQVAVKENRSVLLRNYLSWVQDDTLVETADRLNIAPIAWLDNGAWRFSVEHRASVLAARGLSPSPRVIVDGVFFQHSQLSGIARVWRALLAQWLKSGFSRHILLLDRAGSAPRLPGLRYRSVPAWDETGTGQDSLMLQRICEEENAELFISSYYTCPISVPSIFLAHDMIPERLGASSDDQVWAEKKLAILHALKHVCVSESTRNDLLHFYPEVTPDRTVVIPNSADAVFRPASAEELERFRASSGLTRPYFLIVGERRGLLGYKNGEQLFGVFGSWPERNRFDLVCVGGIEKIEKDFRTLAGGATIHHLKLDDEELRLAYAGAVALLYPSRYEGFGIPLLEAMACGCPVVTTRGSSIPEVGGDAPIYFDIDRPGDLQRALDEVIRADVRESAIARGLTRARSFNWADTAEQYEDLFRALAVAPNARKPASDARLWAAFREEQTRQQALTRRLRRKLDNSLLWVCARSGRASLFRLRTFLLRHLPKGAIPAARLVWRLLMGKPDA